MRSVTTVLAACTLVVAGLSATPASAAAGPHCGDVLTHNARLMQDLVCSGGWISVGRGVTFDLNHHTISAGTPSDAGVLVGNGSRVTNGVLSGFAPALFNGLESQSAIADRVTFRGNALAVSADHLALTLRDDLFDGNQVGVTMTGGALDVTHSTFRNNGEALVEPGGQMTVRDSLFERNGSVASCVQGTMSFLSSVARNNSAGLLLDQCDGSHISDSSFINDGTAVELDSFYPLFVGLSMTVTRSNFSGNATAIEMYNVVGLGEGGSISHNRFTGNGTALHASDALCGGCAVSSAPYAISDNVFRGNSGDGAHLDANAAPATVHGNVAINNGSWGLYVDPSTGSVDGGGNVGSGNGQPAQCFGVTCAP